LRMTNHGGDHSSWREVLLRMTTRGGCEKNMRYENNDRLREYLDRGATGAYREHMRHPYFELDATAFAATLAEVQAQHSALTSQEAEARTAFRLLTSGAPPSVAMALPSRRYRAEAWARRVAPQAW